MSSPSQQAVSAQRTGVPARLPLVLAIGFTGHRRLPDEAASRRRILELLREQKAATPGIVYGVSSAAAGADLLFAESCLELEIPLRILLPMPEEEFRNDFDAATWERAQQVMRAALSVEIAGDGRSRDERYYECGIATVQQSQMLLALWDGQSARGLGGTAEIMAFADTIGRPIVWLHSESGAVEMRNRDALQKLLHDPELKFLNALPGRPADSGNPLDLARAWFAKLDTQANKFAPRSRGLASIPIVYTAAAAVLSAAAEHGSGAMRATWLGISAGLGIFAAALPIILRLDHWQALWARTRTPAEATRAVLALWNSPAGYETIGPETMPELETMLRSLQFLKMRDGTRNRDALDVFRDTYRRERVQDQMNYFERQARRAQRTGRKYRLTGNLCAAGAVAIAVWLFAGRAHLLGRHPAPAGLWFPLAMSALFQVTTVAGALVVIRDCDRRRVRYRELSSWLRAWDAELAALRTWSAVLDVAGRIERALLVELLEWRSLIRHARMPRK